MGGAGGLGGGRAARSLLSPIIRSGSGRGSRRGRRKGDGPRGFPRPVVLPLRIRPRSHRGTEQRWSMGAALPPCSDGGRRRPVETQWDVTPPSGSPDDGPGEDDREAGHRHYGPRQREGNSQRQEIAAARSADRRSWLPSHRSGWSDGAVSGPSRARATLGRLAVCGCAGELLRRATRLVIPPVRGALRPILVLPRARGSGDLSATRVLCHAVAQNFSALTPCLALACALRDEFCATAPH